MNRWTYLSALNSMIMSIHAVSNVKSLSIQSYSISIPQNVFSICWCGILVPAATSTAAAASTAASIVSTLSGSSITIASHIGSRPLFLDFVVLLIVSDSFAFIETFVSILVNGGKMHKDIFRTILRCNESEPLVREELDGAVESHDAVWLVAADCCERCLGGSKNDWWWFV